MELIREGEKIICISTYAEKDIPKNAGCRWDRDARHWWTTDVRVAEKLIEYADANVKTYIGEEKKRMADKISASSAVSADIDIPVPQECEYLPFQKAGIKYASERKNVLIADEMGLGKAQPVDAKLLTPDGWKLMGDIRIGDSVFGSDGLPHYVRGVYPQGEKEVYRIKFTDGAETECTKEHLWQVQTPLRKWQKYAPRVVKLSDIVDRLFDPDGNTEFFIPIVRPLEFQSRKLILDPYLLGALLGDGKLATGTPMFSSADKEIIKEIEARLPLRMKAIHSGNYDYRLVTPKIDKISLTEKNPLKKALENLNLRCRSEHKFIPDIYKFSSIYQRKLLLAGLMDTDGSVSDGIMEFSSVSERLCDDVQFIIESFGGKAVKSSRVPIYTYKGEKHNGQRSYRLHISLANDFNPFFLKRKADKFHPCIKYLPARGIVSVVSMGIKLCQCIAVDSPDNLYVTDHCILTHNTIQAIGLINLLHPASVLIVCPASLKLNWKRECEKWLVEQRTISVVNQQYCNTEIVICNYDILKKFHTEIHGVDEQKKWGMVIYDECHYGKNPKAQRSREMYSIQAEIRVCLTGTPILNRPVELQPILKMLNVEFAKNWSYFVKKFCNGHQDRWGWDVSGASNLEELQENLRSTVMIRRLKKDVLKELPAKRRKIIEIAKENGLEKQVEKEKSFVKKSELEIKEIRKRIKELKESGDESTYKTEVEKLKNLQQVAFVEIAKLRHETALLKVPKSLETIIDTVEATGKVVVFAHHHDVIENLKKGLEEKEINVVVMTGETSVEDRQKAVDAFQTDEKIHVFLGSIKASGLGITLTAASNVIFCELDWTPSAISQAEDRCHRIGQDESVLVQHIVVDESIDSMLAKKLVKKQVIIDKTLNKSEISDDVELFDEEERNV